MVVVHGIGEDLADLQMTAEKADLGERQKMQGDLIAAEAGEQLRIAVGGSAPELHVSYLKILSGLRN